MRSFVLRRSALALTAGAVIGLTAACGGANASGIGATELGSPLSIPAGSFTDTAGQNYDLASASKGHLTLVFFGYTHCPDECPTTMADLGQALRSLPRDKAAKVQVVFITSDPARDTPAAMHQWLSHFDQGLPRPFLGLTTHNVASVDAFGRKLLVPLEPPTTQKDGTIDVTHGAQTIAFSPSTAQARYVWLLGTPVQQYASDITKLLNT